MGGSKPAQRAQRGGILFRGVHGRPAPARVESSPDDTLIRLGMYEL
ncbi:hypothetical protein AZ21_2160 [Bordetella bronchiseptica B20-10725633]|nr:hypothetical protein AZ21_2160 [Bordetella bronchiseptica B20-10725633]